MKIDRFGVKLSTLGSHLTDLVNLCDRDLSYINNWIADNRQIER